MRISVMVDFDVQPDNGEDEITQQQAISACDGAIYDNLVLTDNGLNVIDGTGVHVDGFGWTIVKLAESLE